MPKQHTNNPYMDFCARTRCTAAFKKRSRGLSAAQQGVILGQMYRSAAKPTCGAKYRSSAKKKPFNVVFPGQRCPDFTTRSMTVETLIDTIQSLKGAKDDKIMFIHDSPTQGNTSMKETSIELATWIDNEWFFDNLSLFQEHFNYFTTPVKLLFKIKNCLK